MRNLVGYAGMTVGGAVGWWLGDLHGIFLAILLSSVGSGLGLYYGRKLAADYLE